jgi:hypothetical protein
MKIPEPYRGIAYSISDKGAGKWEWKLHPKVEPNIFREIRSGEVSGTQDDAIRGAEAAIDEMLDGKSN